MTADARPAALLDALIEHGLKLVIQVGNEEVTLTRTADRTEKGDANWRKMIETVLGVLCSPEYHAIVEADGRSNPHVN